MKIYIDLGSIRPNPEFGKRNVVATEWNLISPIELSDPTLLHIEGSKTWGDKYVYVIDGKPTKNHSRILNLIPGTTIEEQRQFGDKKDTREFLFDYLTDGFFTAFQIKETIEEALERLSHVSSKVYWKVRKETVRKRREQRKAWLSEAATLSVNGQPELTTATNGTV